jgi:hypothetical protein
MSAMKKLFAELSIACTRNQAGQHFTEYLSHWEELERMGLIAIDRPVHKPTGIPYGQQDWTLTVTDEGMVVVQSMSY